MAALREWIEGATIQKAGGDCDSENSTTAAQTGFAWSLYDQTLSTFKLLSILVPLNSAKSSKTDARTLTELLGKLFLWGDGFRDGRLESVLDESDDLRQTVMGELTRIGNILISELVPFCLVDTLPSTGDELRRLTGELGILLEKAKLVTESDYESDAASHEDSDAFLGIDQSSRTISSLRTGIECLMELLPSMENALEYTQQTSLDDEATSTVEFQVSGPARTYVLNVYDRFAKADARLVERLGEANWQRHTALRAGITQQNEAVDMPKSVFVPVSMFHDSGIGTSIPAHSSYAATVASHSSFVSALVDRDGGSFRVPPTPKEVSQGVPFACGICGDTLIRIKNRVDWKRHVFADLNPYICTFSSCKDKLLTFSTRKLWEEHEFTQHRVDHSWDCWNCSQSLPNPNQWRDHLREHHGTVFNDSQFEIASKMTEQRTPQPVDSQQCPLCLCFPGKSKRNFATHVGKHMEGIALAALPRELTCDSESEDESLEGKSMPSFPAPNASNSPSLGPTSIPTSAQQLEQAKAARKLVIHLLAMQPMMEKALKNSLPNVSKNDLKQVLEKVCDYNDTTHKWELKKQFYKELDVWTFNYDSNADRIRAIDNAIKQYDKMRLGISEPEWDRLLVKSERGTGKHLGKLQAQIAQSNARPPKIKAQKADGSDTPNDEDEDLFGDKNLSKVKDEGIARSASQLATTKIKKTGEKSALVKRLLSKIPSKDAAKTAPWSATPKKQAPPESPTSTSEYNWSWTCCNCGSTLALSMDTFACVSCHRKRCDGCRWKFF